jgi:hypothetical protein
MEIKEGKTLGNCLVGKKNGIFLGGTESGIFLVGTERGNYLAGTKSRKLKVKRTGIFCGKKEKE